MQGERKETRIDHVGVQGPFYQGIEDSQVRELIDKKEPYNAGTANSLSVASCVGQRKQKIRKNAPNEPRARSNKETSPMKLSAFAQWAGVGYKTAWNWWKSGTMKGYQTESGTIVITENSTKNPRQEIVRVVYARVSANENRPNLDAQADLLCAYCEAKGWKVGNVVKEVGSGINNSRRKLLAILADPSKWSTPART